MQKATATLLPSPSSSFLLQRSQEGDGNFATLAFFSFCCTAEGDDNIAIITFFLFFYCITMKKATTTLLFLPFFFYIVEGDINVAIIAFFLFFVIAQQRRQRQHCYCRLLFSFCCNKEGNGSNVAVTFFFSFFCCSKEKKATAIKLPSTSSFSFVVVQ